jgi:hypothetical protein
VYIKKKKQQRVCFRLIYIKKKNIFFSPAFAFVLLFKITKFHLYQINQCYSVKYNNLLRFCIHHIIYVVKKKKLSHYIIIIIIIIYITLSSNREKKEKNNNHTTATNVE